MIANPPAHSIPIDATHARVGQRRPIQVMVVDDHPAIRAGVRRLLDEEPDMRVVSEAASAEEALATVDCLADVLVVDYHLVGGRNGLWLTHRLTMLKRPPSVLIYSAFADEVLAVAAIVAGADGLLDKRSLGEELCNVVRRLANGRRYMPAISRSIIRALGSQLGPRDETVFGMLLHGVEAREVTERMTMSDSQLASSRWRILLGLAPKIGASGVAPKRHMPLDYEPVGAALGAGGAARA
jgi:DNA-binding NarL/FixJ family response regulator